MSTRRLVASTVGAQIARQALTLVSGPILSRLIGPVPYGVIAPAQSVGALGKLVAESGFAYHTVTTSTLAPGQARDLHHQSVRLATVIATVAGVLAASIGDVPPWQRVVRGGLAIMTVVLAGLTAVPYAWNQREGRMARFEWFGVAGQAAATFTVAIPLAFLGSGLIAATANLYIPLLLTTVLAWRLSGLHREEAEKTRIDRGYRVGTLGANAATYLAGNIDLLLLSTYLTTDFLGVYSRAILLSSLPGNVIGASVGKVGLVSLSKSDRWEDHRRFLVKATALLIGGFSLLEALSFAGLDLMRIAFGPRFATSPVGFGWLILSQSFFFFGSILDTYLTVRRHMASVAVSHSLQALLLAGLLVAMRPTTLLGISLAILASSSLRYAGVLIQIAISIPRWYSSGAPPSGESGA